MSSTAHSTQHVLVVDGGASFGVDVAVQVGFM